MKIKDIKAMIKEVMESKQVLLSKPGLIKEANYGRVKRKIEIEKVPFMMISAFRGGLSKRENLDRQRKLEESVASSGYPWTKMPGSGYVEMPEEEGEPVDMQQDSPEAAGGIEVKENSIIVWDETRHDIPKQGAEDTSLFALGKFLAKKFDQDSFIFGEPVEVPRTGQSRMNILIYDKLGEELDWGGPWTTLKQIEDDDVFWSSIGGKKAKLSEMLEKHRNSPVRSKKDAIKKQYTIDKIKAALSRMS
jgi:hypothetical protein